MALFRAFAYLAPLLAAFAVVAALALDAGRSPRRRAGSAAAVLGTIGLLLLLGSFTESVRLAFPLLALMLSFAGFAAGLFLLAESLRVPREAAQVVAGVVCSVLMASVHCFGPAIRASADAGASGRTIYERISMAMGVNPFFATGYSVFETDLLHLAVFYRMGLADFQHGEPSWGRTSIGYALAAALLLGLAAAFRRWMPR